MSSGGKYDWQSHDIVRAYVLGGHVQSSIPWVEVDFVYIPMQIPVIDHWVLLVLHVPRICVVLYDSLFGKPSHDALVDEKITSIVNFLPHVMDSVGAFEGVDVLQKGTNPFTVERALNIPQQDNGYVFF